MTQLVPRIRPRLVIPGTQRPRPTTFLVVSSPQYARNADCFVTQFSCWHSSLQANFFFGRIESEYSLTFDTPVAAIAVSYDGALVISPDQMSEFEV
jgi:hypothetical protein